jgi:FdhD protein
MNILPIPPGPVADEAACSLFLNDEALVSLWCSPADLEDLALGYLMSTRRIDRPADLDSIEVETPGENQDDGIWVIRTTAAAASQGGGKTKSDTGSTTAAQPTSPTRPAAGTDVESGFRVTLGPLRDAARKIMEEGPLRLATGGVHSAGALLPDGRVIIREDVSRHCALDKAIGAAARLMAEKPLLGEVCLLSSGRAAQEMVQKAVNVEAPVFATRGIPTTPAYRLAHLSGITLIGQVLSPRPIAYTGANRVRE